MNCLDRVYRIKQYYNARGMRKKKKKNDYAANRRKNDNETNRSAARPQNRVYAKSDVTRPREGQTLGRKKSPRPKGGGAFA